MNKAEKIVYISNYIESLQTYLDRTREYEINVKKGSRMNEAQLRDHTRTPKMRNSVIEELYRAKRELVSMKATPDILQIETVSTYRI